MSLIQWLAGEKYIQHKGFWGRIFCEHYWAELHIPDDLVFMNGKFKYQCLNCGKVKSFRNHPVNRTRGGYLT